MAAAPEPGTNTVVLQPCTGISANYTTPRGSPSSSSGSPRLIGTNMGTSDSGAVGSSSNGSQSLISPNMGRGHIRAAGSSSTSSRKGSGRGDPQTLRILTWNGHGLSGSKLLALEALSSEERADIIVSTETELQKEDIPTLPGFDSFLPKVINSTRRRAAMFIRKQFYAEQLLTPADIPVVAAKLNNKTAVIGIYRQFCLPTSTRTSSTRGLIFENGQMDSLAELITDLSDKFKYLLVVGDLNLDMARADNLDYYRHSLLSRWKSLCEEHSLIWMPTGPTFKSDGSFDGTHKMATLDHVYSRSSDVGVAKVLPDAGSDHSPVVATVHVGAARAKKKDKKRRTERNWKSLDKKALEVFLLSWDWQPVLDSKNVDTISHLINEAIMAALDMVAPLKEFVTPNNSLRLKPDTRAMMRARDAAKRAGNKQYKVLRNKALSLVRRDFVQSNLSRIVRGGQSSAWSIVAEVNGKEKDHCLPLPDGCNTNFSAANVCNDFFVRKIERLRQGFSKNPSIPDNESQFDSIGNFRFQCVGIAKVREALKTLAPKNAVGIDGIPITVYKAAWAALALPVVHLVNQVISTSTWPMEWKIATIVPVLKNGKPRMDIASYRPVSLLCAISKLVERVLFNQIAEHIESNGILPHEQHGFRASRGVDTALARLFTNIALAKDRGSKVGLLAFDFSAAFDTVDAKVLLKKIPLDE